MTIKNYKEYDAIKDFDTTLPRMTQYVKHPVVKKLMPGNKAVYFQLELSKKGKVHITEEYIAIFKVVGGKTKLVFLEE